MQFCLARGRAIALFISNWQPRAERRPWSCNHRESRGLGAAGCRRPGVQRTSIREAIPKCKANHRLRASTPPLTRSNLAAFYAGLPLPLIGGSVALIGNPARADVPTSDELLNAYDEWLYFERKRLQIERVGMERAKHSVRAIRCTPANRFFFPNWPAKWDEQPQPSTRAAVVLSAVGCA
jgi:hypothetical protein